MSEEDKKVEETTEEETLEQNDVNIEQDEDLSEQDSEENESEEGEQSDDEDIDYKSEFERLNGELAQKNERIQKQDKKIIKLKKRKKEESSYDEEELEEEDQDIDLLVEEKVKNQMASLVDDTIEEELNNVSTNDDEKKLIKWYFDNRIIKLGWSRKDIKDYISDAKVLANKGKNLIKSNLMKKQEQSKKTTGSPNYAGTPPKKQSYKVTEHDKTMARKYFKGDVKKWMKFKHN